MTNKIFTEFRVIGYEMKTPEGNFLQSCSHWVIAENEKNAIAKAKKKVKNKYYQVVETIERLEK